MPDQTNPLIAKEKPDRPSPLVYQSSALAFNLALVLFIVSAVVYGGLFFYRKSIDATITDWHEKIAGKEEELNSEGGVASLIDTSDSIGAAQALIESHVFTSNVFTFLQEVTHQRVQFYTFGFARDTRKIELSGLAISYRTVAEQISVLESSPQVEKVEFGGLSLTDQGLINFKLSVTYKPVLLKLRLSESGEEAAATGE